LYINASTGQLKANLVNRDPPAGRHCSQEMAQTGWSRCGVKFVDSRHLG